MLPSNHSLHDDLILEELEVFKVCSVFLPSLFFFLFHFNPLSPLKSKAGTGRRMCLATTQRPRADRQKAGWHLQDGCSVVQSSVE